MLAWILLVNASLGVGVWASRLAFTDAAMLQPGELPWFGLLGVAAGLLCLGRQTAGLWGAVLFYTMQVAIYYPVTPGGRSASRPASASARCSCCRAASWW